VVNRNQALALLALLLCLVPAAILSPIGCASSAKAPTASQSLRPPVAAKDPVVRDIHGERFVDDYAWLKNREDPRTIPYLNAENEFAERQTAHLKPLRDRLYKEMLSRIKEDDTTAPYRKGEYWYYSRTEKNKPYRVYCRKKGSLEAKEEPYLDANAMGAGKDFFDIGVIDISEDHRILAYSTDELGNERYTMRFKDLSTGKVLSDAVENTSDASAWANDNQTFFYTKVDATTRPFQLWRHTLGTPASSDVLVYEEKDERFRLNVERARQGRFILISLESNASNEWWSIDADNPTAGPKLIGERRDKVEYSVDVGNDRFYIVTNDQHVNFRLAEAPISDPRAANWRTLIGGREGVTIEGIDAFARHLVVYERENGLQIIRVRRLEDSSDHSVVFDDAAYSTRPGNNEEYRSAALRFTYESPITPRSTYDYDMNTRERTLVKRIEVPNYDASKYMVERLSAPAPDGKLVPITIVRPRDFARNGSAAGLLDGYGSYGISSDPAFDSSIFSFVDRGMVCATAHIRGGADLGRTWYEDGRLRNKKNTFTDFIACAEYLQQQGYVARDRLAITGGSAGGLLMGAVTNMRPDLFAVVIAFVPFVDVMNTMLDPTIPLTVTEWEQWGDPRTPGDYAYMRSYSPYDNVEAKAYPSMMVRAGLNDPRVGYWEPAKWVARMRALKTDSNPLLLVTNMDAGHGGSSDRYEALREWADVAAFVLDRVGITR
jgi:oligopeptidase B